nr:MAG TPA: hypothetical protein [Caudoviricetes sp.]
MYATLIQPANFAALSLIWIEAKHSFIINF